MPEKRAAELGQHEAIFGSATYVDAYYVTDLDTWVQDFTPCVTDLERTSILVSPETELTKLVAHGVVEKKKVAKKSLRKRLSEEAKIVTVGEQHSPDSQLQTFLASKFPVPLQDIRMDEKTHRGDKVIIPTRCKKCPFAKREHKSNQLYFVLREREAELRCHDDECNEKLHVALIMDETIGSRNVSTILQTEETIVTQRMAAVTASLNKVKQLHPRG